MAAATSSIVCEPQNMFSKTRESIRSEPVPVVPPKLVPNLERMSPASLDSLLSSFPSSPESSLDAPVPTLTQVPRRGLLAPRPRKRPCLQDDVAVVPHWRTDPCCSKSTTPISSTTSNASLIPINEDETNCKTKDSTLKISTNITERVYNDVELKENEKNEIDVETSANVTVLEIKELHSSEPSTSSTPSVSSTDYHLKSRCCWRDCTEGFNSDNDLYDHVIKIHLNPMRPLDGEEEANAGEKVSNGEENESKSAKKSRPINDETEKNQAEDFECQWGICRMKLCRGDSHRKFTWLEEHFTTRHAKKAQPYPCLIKGCAMRFSLKRLLEDHLRTGHDKPKAKKHDDSNVGKPKSCFEWTPLPYYKPCDNYDFYDNATDMWVLMRLRKFENMPNACFVPRPPPTPRGGAAYRKRHRLLMYDVVHCPDLTDEQIERKKKWQRGESISE